VQPLEAAVVRSIHVQDGDHVVAGQSLIDLDATDSHADGERAASDRSAAISELLRTRALLAALTTVGQPSLLVAPREEGWSSSDRANAEVQLRTEWADITAKLSQLRAEAEHRKAEIATADEQVAKLEATVPMARQRESDFKALSQEGYVGAHQAQDRLRERVELERDLATSRARRVEAQAALQEAERALDAYRSETVRTLRERQSQAELKRDESGLLVAKSAQHVRFAHLVAPVTGTVQQLAVHTEGGVVTPAEVLLVLVPDRAQVTAEVKLQNQDIGFVREGQNAEIKLETFPFTRYGTIKATVSTITADAVVDKQPKDPSGTESAYFPARLTLARGDIDVDGRRIRLSPGMNLSAEIVTGKRRVIDYLLSPVRQHLSEAGIER
jgi:hemolysin D